MSPSLSTCESCGLPHQGTAICAEMRRRAAEIIRLRNENRLLRVHVEKLKDYVAANVPHEAAGGRSVAQQIEEVFLKDLNTFQRMRREAKR